MQEKRTYRIKAAIYTIVIHGILAFVLIWYHFKTPNPPYPEGGGGTGMGLEINLGQPDAGLNEPNLADNMVVNNEVATPVEEVEPIKEEILTSDQETESIKDVVPVKKEKPKEQKKLKVEVTKQPIVKPKAEPKKEIETPKVNTKALYSAKAKGGNSAGSGGKEGSEGSPDGVEGSGLYKGNGVGAGTGSGGGSGNGIGANAGDGISFNLAGRNPLSLPKPDYNYQEEGKVVVEVTVDKNGNVTNAVAGVKGSNTLDEYLLMAAKKAAMLAKFDTKANAPAFQKGTITYHFKLQ